MRERLALVLVTAGIMAGAGGCKKPMDTSGFKAAINQSYAGKHECVFAEPAKLPVEIDPSKDDRVRALDALTTAGLLNRETEEKKHPRALPTTTSKYTLSDKGHSSWTPDPKQEGYGNFCFGHFNVTAVTKAVPNDAANPTQYAVTYHYEVEGLPGWVQTPESMRTFRKIAADTSIQTATATLVKGADGGWTVAGSPAGQ